MIHKNMFETVSSHIVKPCNMSCKFCYATFEDFNVPSQLSISDATEIVWKLKEAGMQKITFAGGEPLLYKNLPELIEFSKSLGLTTSIITNGSLLTNEFMQRMKGKLDWLGVSIDSLNPATNDKIGRRAKSLMSRNDYVALIEKIKANKFKLKINTVVNAYNKEEDMRGFITYAMPERWKVFQTLRIEGQNDAAWDEIKVNVDEFNSFVNRHANCPNLVPENNRDMTGSYLLVDPLGRFFENTKGTHTYSQPIHGLKVKVVDRLNEITLDRSRFESRGGLYKW